MFRKLGFLALLVAMFDSMALPAWCEGPYIIGSNLADTFATAAARRRWALLLKFSAPPPAR